KASSDGAWRAVADHLVAVLAPMPAKLVHMSVAVGDTVQRGAQIAVLEAMKMEHVLLAQAAGKVVEVRCAVGSYLSESQPLVVLEPAEQTDDVAASEQVMDLEAIRPDLQKMIDRQAYTLDAN